MSDLEQSDEITTNQTATVTANVTFPLTKKRVKSGCMKMHGHGVITSSNLLLFNSYQDLVDIDDDFTMTGTINSIPRKQTHYCTIQWENNSVTTKIWNKSLWMHVMKCGKKCQNVYLMPKEGLICYIQTVNLSKN